MVLVYPIPYQGLWVITIRQNDTQKTDAKVHGDSKRERIPRDGHSDE
jgi:hypothetical protein